VSAALALRAAVFQRLAGDAALASLLGGARIHDEPPRGAAPPYVALAGVQSRELAGGDAEEHEVSLEVWSREGGLSEALRIADRTVRLLDGAPLVLDGWRLAALAWRFTDAGRTAEPGRRRAVVAFRAVTEPGA
jgi:hypothetical protein